MSLPLFDTHAHLVADDWERYPARAFGAGVPMPPRPSYSVTIEALVGMMDAEGVREACLVQRGHVYGYDNSYIIDSARKFPGRFHPVVIMDPQDPATADRYRAMVREDGVRGFRLAAVRPWFLDTSWLCSQPAMDVWRACADLGTPMTLIVFMKHLPFCLPLIEILARQFPELPILLDHAAMPYGVTQYEVGLAEATGEPILNPPPPDFGIDATIRRFADVPNVHFKLTEINMERFEATGVRGARVVRYMADCFGADRLMWGSDIGQSMRWDYPAKAAMARAAADFLSEDEARAFLHGNAARIYGLADIKAKQPVETRTVAPTLEAISRAP